MPRMNVALLRRTRAMVPTLVLACGLLAACNNSNNGRTIINNNGLDCGLVANDLRGDWIVNFASGARDLMNCNPSSFDTTGSTGVSVNSTAMTFSNVDVSGSNFAASFLVTADGTDPAQVAELLGSVQADSCLALFKVWIGSYKTYVVCLGAFDVATRTIAASCDSAEPDNPVDGKIDATCDLSTVLNVAVTIP